MLKIRLKRIGRKKEPWYRLVIMENSTRRDGYAIEEVGYYSPITKKSQYKAERILFWLSVGAKPTHTVERLFLKSKFIK